MASKKNKSVLVNPGPYPARGDHSNVALFQTGSGWNRKQPYEEAAADLQNGTGRFARLGSVEEVTREEAILRARLADYGKQAAHLIADRIEGKIGFDELLDRAARIAHNRKLLDYRDAMQLPTDPAPTRGEVDHPDIDKFLERRPSVGVNLGVLRSLEIAGTNLSASDFALFWTLVAVTFSWKTTQVERSVLRRLLKVSDNKRLLGQLQNLSNATFSLTDEPTIRKDLRFCGIQMFSFEQHGKEIEWSIDNRLLSLISPRCKGPRYAYLCIYTVQQLTARWQEHAYRRFLAAATASGAYSAEGGGCLWGLGVADVHRLWGNPEVDPKLFKARFFNPLKDALKKVESRIQLEEFEPIYDERKQGKPLAAALVRFKVVEASKSEKPKKARQRYIQEVDWKFTEHRINLVGLGQVTPEMEAAERSRRATVGHQNKKARHEAEKTRLAREFVLRRLAAQPRRPLPEIICDPLPEAQRPISSDATIDEIYEYFSGPETEPIEQAQKRAFAYDPRIILLFGHNPPDHIWEWDIAALITALEDEADQYRSAAVQEDEAPFPDFLNGAEDEEINHLDEIALRELQDGWEFDRDESFDD